VDKTKCDKCREAEATVYFAAISGKGRASRHRYCPKCAKEERVRLLPSVIPQGQQPSSVLDMVRQELDKTASGEPTAAETTEQAVKRLNRAMQAAIAKEDYEKAAKIRDEIAAIQPQGGTKDQTK
jgi:protein-arginine kinase activator protein McsA